MAEFHLEIVSPYRRFLSEAVDYIIFETWDGEMELLPGHEPMMMPVRPCLARIRQGEQRRYLVLTAGVALVGARSVELFVDAAEWPEEIDKARAQRALERALGRLTSGALEFQLEWSKEAAARARARLAACRQAESSAM